MFDTDAFKQLIKQMTVLNDEAAGLHWSRHNRWIFDAKCSPCKQFLPWIPATNYSDELHWRITATDMESRGVLFSSV